MTMQLSVQKFANLGHPWMHWYSELKFGNDPIAQQFGWEMAETLQKEAPWFLADPVIVIAAPSSATVPAASTLLAHHMMQRLNMLAIRHGRPLADWTPVHRITTYYDNYAHLPKEQREKLLANDSIFINRDFIRNKNLIFVDDCNITGTHEKKIEDFLEAQGIDNRRLHVYYAKYTGEDAGIEGRLNHVSIVGAECLADKITASDLYPMSFGPRYILTTRAVRMFLECEPSKLPSILERLSNHRIAELYHASIAKEYHTHPMFMANFKILEMVFNEYY